MTPDERDAFWARLYRLRAAAHDAAAARDRLDATAIETSGALRRFAESWTEAERAEVAAHPDLAELNVQLDGYYGAAERPATWGSS